MTLFDEWDRTDRRPSGQSEVHWRFLDRVAGPYWDQVRTLLNDWFEHLSDAEARAGIRGRMRGKEDSEFNSALAELYVHEMLLRAGYSVIYEPAVTGSARRPDFLAIRGDERMYVEVTSRQIWAKSGGDVKREAALYDAIDAMNSDNFTLSFEVERRGPRSPSPRAIIRALTNWLAKLDPDEVLPAISVQGFRAMPELTFDRDGWVIVFGAIPIPKEHRSRNNDRRTIGISGGGGGGVNDADVIRDALADKTHAYGEMDAPYVVALALDHIRSDEVETALYGGKSVRIQSDEVEDGWRTIPGRDSRGYWSSGETSRRSHVSGMLVLPGGLPYKVAEGAPTLWINPHAMRPAAALDVWAQVEVADHGLATAEASIPPWVFFGLSREWPLGEPWAW